MLYSALSVDKGVENTLKNRLNQRATIITYDELGSEAANLA